MRGECKVMLHCTRNEYLMRDWCCLGLKCPSLSCCAWSRLPKLSFCMAMSVRMGKLSSQSRTDSRHSSPTVYIVIVQASQHPTRRSARNGLGVGEVLVIMCQGWRGYVPNDKHDESGQPQHHKQLQVLALPALGGCVHVEKRAVPYGLPHHNHIHK